MKTRNIYSSMLMNIDPEIEPGVTPEKEIRGNPERSSIAPRVPDGIPVQDSVHRFVFCGETGGEPFSTLTPFGLREIQGLHSSRLIT